MVFATFHRNSSSLLFLLLLLVALSEVSGEGRGRLLKQHRRHHLHHLQEVMTLPNKNSVSGGGETRESTHGGSNEIIGGDGDSVDPTVDGGTTAELLTEDLQFLPSSSLLGGPRNCSSCANRELFKNFTREDIKEKILRKLGMVAAPNITTEAVPTHLIRQLLSRYRTELDVSTQGDDPYAAAPTPGGGGMRLLEEDDYHFQTRQINIIAKEPVDGEVPPPIVGLWPDIQYFPVDTPNLRDNWREVTKAHLWVHLPKAPTPDDTHAWINLYYVSVDKNNHAFLTQEAATKVKLRQTVGGWVEISVWDIASLWFKNPDMNLGIVIHVNTSTGVALKIGAAHQPKAAPFLQLDIRESSLNNRRTRSLNKVCSEETDSAETHCCLWPFTVDFEKEFGWKWIIYPSKYQANFCSGDCSLGVMMPSNPWAHLLQQANGSPCCAPQKMSGINMLYMDEHKNVILGKLPNMKVERCGCA